jgi:hypothetical protein
MRMDLLFLANVPVMATEGWNGSWNSKTNSPALGFAMHTLFARGVMRKVDFSFLVERENAIL